MNNKERQLKGLGERIGKITRILGAVGVPVGFVFSPEVFSIAVFVIVLGEGARRLSAGKRKMDRERDSTEVGVGFDKIETLGR